MTDRGWSIDVELDERNASGDAVDDLMEALAHVHPAIGTAPNGNLSIRITVDAPTAYAAFDLGTARVRDAARMCGLAHVVEGVHLETESEQARQLKVSDNALFEI